MKPFPLVLVLTLLAAWGAPLCAAERFVSPTGSNANAGTQAAPWATLGHALSASSGSDVIHLARGATFREGGLSIGDSRTLRAYGDPALPLPIVSGSTLVTGLSPWATNSQISTVTFTQGPVRQVFVNGTRLTLARTPDTGWLRTDTGNNNNRIVDAALGALPGAASGRWVGANVRWRKWTWIYETRPITADNGTNQLDLGGSTTLGLTADDSGYYIDNALAALDRPGEWFFQSSTNTLFIYLPTGTNPATATIEAAWREKALDLNRATVEDIAFQHFHDALSINQPSTLRRCTVRMGSNNAISGTWNAGPTLITGCTLTDHLNSAIRWVENPSGAGGTIFERNTIQRMGNIPGLGGSGSWAASGIVLDFSAPVIIRLNRLSDIGYAGILPNQPGGSTIERNVLIRCMATLNDGAAIYTNSSNNTIRENIVIDTIGDLDSSQEWFPLGHGIWPEFIGNYVNNDILHNTLYGNGGTGIFLSNNYTCEVRNNVSVSNRSSGLQLGGGEDGHASAANFQQNHSITDNILAIGARPWAPVPTRVYRHPWWFTSNDFLLAYETFSDRDLDFGTMSGTRFVNQDGLDRIRQANHTTLTQTIAQWQASESAWADPAPSTTVGNTFLFINDTETAFTFTLPAGITWQNLDTSSAGTSVVVAPFRSVLLLAASVTTTALPGYFLASESVPVPVLTNALVTFRATHLLPTDGSQDTAQPAGDGVANLLKYAFNLIGTDTSAGQRPTLQTPNVAALTATGTAGLPFASLAPNGRLQITYLRRKASPSVNPGITYAVQFASELAPSDWALNPAATISPTSLDETWDRVVVTDSALFSQRFVRVIVTVP